MADTKRLEEKLEIISIDNSCHKNRKPLEEQILKLQDICIGEIIRRYGTLQKENKALLDTIDELLDIKDKAERAEELNVFTCDFSEALAKYTDKEEQR